MSIDATAPCRRSGRRSRRRTADAPHQSSDWDFSFHDLLDIVNPLQHLPVIGTIYRAITGDTYRHAGKDRGRCALWRVVGRGLRRRRCRLRGGHRQGCRRHGAGAVHRSSRRNTCGGSQHGALAAGNVPVTPTPCRLPASARQPRRRRRCTASLEPQGRGQRRWRSARSPPIANP